MSRHHRFMGNTTKTTIKQILSVTGTWHLAIHDPLNSVGARLLPIACWAIVSRSNDSDCVVPLVSHPDEHGGALHHYEPDDDDVVGIAEPGTEIGGVWDDIANQLTKQRIDCEEAEEATANAKKLVDPIAIFDVDHVKTLRQILVTSPSSFVATKSADAIVVLSEYGCISAEKTSSSLRHTWHITQLGRALLALLDKRAK